MSYGPLSAVAFCVGVAARARPIHSTLDGIAVEVGFPTTSSRLAFHRRYAIFSARRSVAFPFARSRLLVRKIQPDPPYSALVLSHFQLSTSCACA